MTQNGDVFIAEVASAEGITETCGAVGTGIAVREPGDALAGSVRVLLCQWSVFERIR